MMHADASDCIPQTDMAVFGPYIDELRSTGVRDVTDPEATILPAGPAATASVLWVCPEKVRICFSFSTSHSRIVRSYEAETR